MKTKMKKLLQLFLLSSFFIMTNCQTEDIHKDTITIENTVKKTKEVNFVSLKNIPDVENIVNGIKKEKSVTNKSINSLDLNQDKIIELLRENGDKSYSLLIDKTFKEGEPYSVENLNVLSENGDYKVLITKWIPLDGKPFYDVEKFIGDLQYFDLNGNLLHSLKIGINDKTAKSNQTAKSQLVITIGCWTYDLIFCGCSDSPYKIVSSSYTCGSGSTSGTTTSGGTTSTGSTTDTSSSGSGGISSGGTTVYSGTGTTTFVPNIPTEDEVERKMYNTFLTSLSKDQYNFLGYYPNVNQDVFNYLADNNFASANKLVAKKMINSAFISYTLGTNASIEFVEWGSNYLIQNSTVTYLQFQNWFMTQSEGKDGDDIIDLNDVLNTLSYQIRSLPTYTNFENNFPKLYWPEHPYYYQTMPAKSVYSIVGGYLESLYLNNGQNSGPYKNACAVRISLALNKIGISIPTNAVTRQGATVNGISQNYFLQAISVNDFMIKTFGDSTYKLEGADANDKNKIAKLLEGKYGIYVIVNNSSTTAGYTGHADLIKNGYVIGGANTSPKGGVKSIRIWILNN